jgi:tetratricopeptide (TPR) repeat protein
MVTSLQATAPSQPGAPAVAARVEARRPGRFRWPIIVGLVILGVAIVYAYAWFDAYRLSSQYLSDADTSYSQGKYLESLVGYQVFDPQKNAYVTKGGYFQAQAIWQSSSAWPKPAGIERADQRINDIINNKITTSEAEQFIQANTGKANPYFGVIYLRLGELYQKQGDTKDARDVYQTVISSFKDQPDMVNQAKQHLAQLGGK